MSKLVDPSTHKDWIRPHSFGWYAQIGGLSGQYKYPWNATVTQPDGEAIFDEEVSRMVQGKEVLDIGCGHGEFAIRLSPVVKRIVGLDATTEFIEIAGKSALANAQFVSANTKERLPFEDGQFDFVYNRRGPTSAYLDVKRVLKKGGKLLALHPGDRSSRELTELFPKLFGPSAEGTPTLDTIKSRLESGMLTAEIETVTCVQYIHEPIDIVRMCCFGQTKSVHEWVINECMSEIDAIFYKHAEEMGLPTTSQHYIVRGIA